MSFSNLTLIVIALVTLGSAAVALSLHNIVRAAMLLVVSWAGIAAFYLWCGAEFIAFAQVLVYVGAISMIVLFAVLLTQRTYVPPPAEAAATRCRIGLGIFTGGALALMLFAAVLTTPLDVPSADAAAPQASVHTLGLELMYTYAGAVLIVGALLTVALLGSILIASTNNPAEANDCALSHSDNKETSR